ncbi:MalY/PatB family protein [uncultured Thiothrix sp.]|uniref:MalY/PatB family protein n=1 Tax=uncultured Thiothrix sp. TaxID=223185 RepID=UPI0026318F69|nr:MalY/PatB family protein [uncultured Thiothrix sp.]
MNFDEVIDRRHTNCMKWDSMQQFYGVSPDTGLAMWVADMDFRPPPAVTAALKAELEHGVHGYFGDESAYKTAISDWMQKRHQWAVDPEWIKTVHGLVAGTALCIQAFTQIGDGIILFTPVYHAFARTIKANQRQVLESPLKIDASGLYRMDLTSLAQQLTGKEKMVILCSPHNPGGRVWSVEELAELAEFCLKHDLLLVSDEIHHDLVFKGYKHTVMPLAAPQIRERLIMLTATTKTFNIAGGLTGNAIIENPELRNQFSQAMLAAGSSPNRFGVLVSTAAYAQGETWLEGLLDYLDGNRRLFDAGIEQIRGLRSMHLEATYLAWVNFAETGLSPQQVIDKVQKEAGIATSYGSTFGSGGETYLRFNLATPRSRIEQALERLKAVFN